VILVDTGPIVAVVNDRDNHHQECKHLLERLPDPLLIPATVATEPRSTGQLWVIILSDW
jgi:predicted nucleic acid-binding protein